MWWLTVSLLPAAACSKSTKQRCEGWALQQSCFSCSVHLFEIQHPKTSQTKNIADRRGEWTSSNTGFDCLFWTACLSNISGHKSVKNARTISVPPLKMLWLGGSIGWQATPNDEHSSRPLEVSRLVLISDGFSLRLWWCPKQLTVGEPKLVRPAKKRIRETLSNVKGVWTWLNDVLPTICFVSSRQTQETGQVKVYYFLIFQAGCNPRNGRFGPHLCGLTKHTKLESIIKNAEAVQGARSLQ